MLPEVGEDGQARLGRARFSPNAEASSWSQRLGARYATAAGWGEVADPAAPSQQVPFSAWFRHEAAAEVGLAAGHVLNASLEQLSETMERRDEW